jgi:hypothetical protein
VDWGVTHDDIVKHLPHDWAKGTTKDEAAISPDAELPAGTAATDGDNEVAHNQEL